MIAAAVHTTGVNWEGVLATAAVVGSFVLLAGGIVTRSFSRSIKGTIADVIDEKVTPRLDRLEGKVGAHDVAIARLQGVGEGRRQAVAEAGVTTVGGST